MKKPVLIILRVVGAVAFVLPVFLIFHALFVPGPLAWGDAPHFYPEGAKELLAEPSAWVNRGINLGGINLSLWLFPLMFIWGISARLGLGNDLTIRLLFYAPALIFALLGPVFLTKYLRFSRTVQFFSGLFYVANTYFILLIDGGVVGVALAYGFFPIAILFLKKFFDRPTYFGFWKALATLSALIIFDPRVAAICIFSFLIWALMSRTSLKYVVLLLLALLGLSLYWLVPLVKLGSQSLEISNLVQVKWQNAVAIFAPHWPDNIFGKTSLPPWYFFGLPALVVIGAAVGKSWRLWALFLVFVFLTMGFFPVAKIPFGTAFRDSTKFFAPAILFAGILIGQLADWLRSKSRIFEILIYSYLLFLVAPALAGKMNFVLSARNAESQFTKIYERLKAEPGSFRTAWFPEKHPLGFETQAKAALNAKDLVNLRPLGRLNGGTYDRFNYLKNPESLEWYKILGIRYLILSGDPRIIGLNKEEQTNWEDLDKTIAAVGGLARLDWGTNFAIYENANPRPRVYAVERLAVVVGPDLPFSFPAVYLEDGKWDPRELEGVDRKLAVLVFNGKKKEDLILSFLQKYFLSAAKANLNQWAFYQSADYLLYKYQLVIRGLRYNDFDYGLGLSFSTQESERIVFDLAVPKDGKYTLAIRGMTGEGAKELALSLNGQNGVIALQKENFGWYVREENLKKGKVQLILENRGGLVVINTVALIPEPEWGKAVNLANTFLNHFSIVGVRDLIDSGWHEVEMTQSGTNRFKVNSSDKGGWIILNDTYHPLWELTEGSAENSSLPLYSAVNVFYKNPGWESTEIVFAGQRQVRWGLWGSMIAFLVLVIVFLWFLPGKKEDN